MQSLRSRPEKKPPQKNAENIFEYAFAVMHNTWHGSPCMHCCKLLLREGKSKSSHHLRCSSPGEFAMLLSLSLRVFGVSFFSYKCIPPSSSLAAYRLLTVLLWQDGNVQARCKGRGIVVYGVELLQRGGACQANKNVFEKMKISGREAYAFPMLDYCDHPRK